MGLAAVEGLPEPIGSAAGCLQHGVRQSGIARDQADQFAAPCLRLKHVGIAVEDKESAGVGVGAVMAEQGARSFSAQPGHLRLVGIKCGDDLGRRILARGTGKTLNETAYRGARAAGPHLVAREAKTLGKIQPHVGVRAAFHLFLGQVAQHNAPQSAVFKTAVQGAEKCWEGGDVVEVFHGIGTQLLARKSAGDPIPVKGMAEQIEGCNPRIEFGHEQSGVHVLSNRRRQVRVLL